MTYAAKVLADSVANGVRLTTLEVTMPRIVLAEFNTHRMLSRNSASSRAIPVEKRIAAVRANPFIPDAFALNKSGMQAGDPLDTERQYDCRFIWLSAMADALNRAEQLRSRDVHKQWANRLLEPFSWHTVIVTATEWENFFNLRISPEAQPEIRRTAELMKAAMDASTPRELQAGEWHLPLINPRIDSGDTVLGVPDQAFSVEMQVKLSVARCARVSYLTHDGKRDVDADLALYDRLLKAGHMSPFEHAAKALSGRHFDGDHSFRFIGNFRYPWLQHRKTLVGEDVFRPGGRAGKVT